MHAIELTKAALQKFFIDLYNVKGKLNVAAKKLKNRDGQIYWDTRQARNACKLQECKF